MKKKYQIPNTIALKVTLINILCASNASYISPKGSLESIGKGNGAW